MFASLRGALTLLWLFVVVVCSALAVQLYGLFQLDIGGQITEVRHSVVDAARDASQQFNLYLSSFTDSRPDFSDSDRQRELLLLLDLALGRYDGIEGGFWSLQNKFIAYSFPTHRPVKRDVPEAESSRISELNQKVLSTHKEETVRYSLTCASRTRFRYPSVSRVFSRISQPAAEVVECGRGETIVRAPLAR
jgi:hypothetical protein